MQMPQKRPQFSVLVTNYNYAKFLPASIGSVLRQTVTDYEIVIVDDGSTDRSAAVIEKLCQRDPRIRALNQKNAGQAAAFNRGFAASRGKIVCFLDADDLWEPGKLEWLARVFAEQPDVGLVQHNLRIVRQNRRTNELYRQDLLSGNVLPMVSSQSNIDFFVPTSGISARRSVLARIFPIPAALRICADAYVTRASITHGPLFSINLPLGGYRIHGNNCWTGNPNRGNPNMVKDSIMPLLMDYYYRCGVRGVARPGSAPAAKPGGAPPANAAKNQPPINREGALVAQVVLERFRQYKDLYSRIAIYGAGAHTRWLFDLLAGTGVYPDQMPEVTAIMDDNAARCTPVAGLEVRLPDAVQPDEFDAVILSSDCFQPQMRTQLQEHFPGARFAIEDVYRGLPSGPYPKLDVAVVNCLQRPPRPAGVQRENAMVFHLVVDRLRKLKATCPRVALYGGGAHSRWLMHLITQSGPAAHRFPKVTVIMDEHPERCEPVGRLTVVSPLQVTARQFDAVIVSSDCQQDAMRDRLRLLFCHSQTPIVDLYEGLPAGPHAKPDAAAQRDLWQQMPAVLRLARTVAPEAQAAADATDEDAPESESEPIAAVLATVTPPPPSQRRNKESSPCSSAPLSPAATATAA